MSAWLTAAQVHSHFPFPLLTSLTRTQAPQRAQEEGRGDNPIVPATFTALEPESVEAAASSDPAPISHKFLITLAPPAPYLRSPVIPNVVKVSGRAFVLLQRFECVLSNCCHGLWSQSPVLQALPSGLGRSGRDPPTTSYILFR